MTQPDGDDPVTALRDIGSALAAGLARVGITSATAPSDLGAHETCRRLLMDGVRPHFIAAYLLHVARQARP